MATFRSLKQWAETRGEDLEDAMIAIKFQIFRSIIVDTRVDTGRLAGGWTTTVGTPAEFSPLRLDPNYAQAISEMTAAIIPDGLNWLTNNVVYAPVWEERDAMVARNVARINQIIASQRV